jgi:hypothetical protein
MRTWPAQRESLYDTVEVLFGGNWRRLFLEKPRPRVDGVYISGNSYVRKGQTEGSYHQPLFKVNYWRYLRFFGDGRVVVVCSPEKPKVIVPLLNLPTFSRKHKRFPVDFGEFEIKEDESISIRTIKVPKNMRQFPQSLARLPPTQLYYHYSLRLASSNKGWHDRFYVNDYYSQDDQRTTNYPPNMIKTFKFLPVPDHILNPRKELDVPAFLQ